MDLRLVQRTMLIFIVVFLVGCAASSFGDSLAHEIVRMKTTALPNVPTYEINALEDLYDATQGDNWDWKPLLGAKWKFTANANPCTEEWQGILCALPSPHTYYYVSTIDLDRYNLNGTLPYSIGEFSQLAVLSLESNRLVGSIPRSITNLTMLQYLGLRNNNLTSTIPKDIGILTNLTEIFLNTNKLTGTLPTSLSRLQKLQHLNIQNNRFTGTLPEAISNCTSLQFLIADVNRFKGTIPTSYGFLQKMNDLVVSSNALTGTIPASLGSIPSLYILDVAQNRLTGTFPASFNALRGLQQLNIGGNLLSGTFPQVISNNYATLNKVGMADNHFSGPIPASFGNLSLITDVDIYENHFTGTIPTSLGQLTALLSFQIYDNRLTGTLPREVCNWRNLTLFFAELNRLTGAIPDCINQWKHVSDLTIGENLFTATLPTGLANMTNLQILHIESNRISGTIPAALGMRSPRLQYIYAAHNLLTGCIPSSLAQAKLFLYLDLSHNLISGPVPTAFAGLIGLNTLALDGNYLSGSLEKVFNASVQRGLVSVQVSDNQLTGTIPKELFRLPKLQAFVGAKNCFHGTLPDTTCEATNLNTLVLDGLSSASSCQQRIFPGASQSYTLTQTVDGAVPQCIYGLPKLVTLHLAGNGFTGSLPAADVVTPTLLDLTLSHNLLSGTIPVGLQLRSWPNLDLSYNRLSGTLTGGDIDPPPAVADMLNRSHETLSLQNNRLSGRIPGSLQHRQDLSMLGTNLFSCRLDGSDLPEHDSDRSSYQCGSDGFNVPFYLWLGGVVTMVGAAGMLWYRNSGSIQIAMARQGRFQALAADSAAPRFHNAWSKLNTVVTFCRAVTAFCVLVLLPAYAALHHWYGTMVHTYAWVVSAAFLSGPTPVGVEMTLWLALLGLLMMMATRYPVSTIGSNSNSKTASNVDAAAAIEWAGNARLRYALFAAIYLATNFIVVGGVNAAYVYIAIYQSSGLLVMAQVLVSLFKLAWNTYGAEYLRKQVAARAGTRGTMSRSGLLSMRIVVALTNNVVIPCLMVACISPNCFYEVFVPPPQVSTTYALSACSFSGLVECLDYDEQLYTLSYSPPFRYSYQCSSGIVTYYAPAFVYLCISTMFVSPLALYVVSRLYHSAYRCSTLHKGLSLVMPWILMPLPEEGEIPYRTYFDASNLLVTQITYFALLLTFGMVFPPLAVALLLTVLCNAYVVQIKIGRFLNLVVARKQLATVTALLDQNCAAVASVDVFRTALWLVLTLSCWFCTLFLFDTLGDAVGFAGAYWVLIVMPLMPVVLFALTKAHKVLAMFRGLSKGTAAARCDNRHADSMIKAEGVEMGSVEDSSATINVMLQRAM